MMKQSLLFALMLIIHRRDAAAIFSRRDLVFVLQKQLSALMIFKVGIKGDCDGVESSPSAQAIRV